jgi:hypothetical protein
VLRDAGTTAVLMPSALRDKTRDSDDERASVVLHLATPAGINTDHSG